MQLLDLGQQTRAIFALWSSSIVCTKFGPKAVEKRSIKFTTQNRISVFIYDSFYRTYVPYSKIGA